MKNIIFKNKRVIYRKESFGGIAQYNSQLFILDKEQFAFIKKFKKYISYSRLNKKEKQIVDEFLKHEIFLKIDENIIKDSI